MSTPFFLDKCFKAEDLPIDGLLRSRLLKIAQDRTCNLRSEIEKALGEYPDETRICVVNTILDVREITTVNIPDDIVNPSENTIIASNIPTPDKN